MAVRLFIVEDQPAAIKGLLKVLDRAEDMEVVGSAIDAETGLAGIRKERPDVLLLDLELPGMDGLALLDALRELDGAAPEVLILTAFQDEDKVYGAVVKGASGYMLKGTDPARLLDAIRTVHQGGCVLQPVITRRFLNMFRSLEAGAPAGDCPLDEEELEVLAMVAKGLTNRETGEVLDLTQRSVRSKLQRIYRKLGVKGRVEAVTKVMSQGWLRV